jgi:hypothetical protein
MVGFLRMVRAGARKSLYSLEVSPQRALVKGKSAALGDEKGRKGED